MRLRLALLGGPDITVTMDATATVADLAGYLSDADPRRSQAVAGGPLTLRCTPPGSAVSQLLSALSTVHESPLRSGSTVEVVPPDDRRPEDSAVLAPVASIRVVGGPDAGREFLLVRGVNYLGRDAAAKIRLNDPAVSRRHASITVGETVVVTDANSTTGVWVDGSRVERANVTSSSSIRLGATTLRISALARPGAPRAQHDALVSVADPRPETLTTFARSPRLEPVYDGLRLKAPTPPKVIERPRFPVTALIAPVLMGTVLFLVTRQTTSLAFVALSPLLMLGGYLDNRVRSRRRGRDDRARFDAALHATRHRLTEAEERERAARLAESPSIDDIRQAVAARSSLLWSRAPEHSAFLEVRLGCGAQPSRNRLELPSDNDSRPDDWEAVTSLAAAFETTDAVPVVERLDRAGSIGIAGDSCLADDAARGLVLQLAGLHSPADLVIAAFAAGESAHRWSWLTWLPHVESSYSPLATSGLAADLAGGVRLLAELEELVETRRSTSTGGSTTVRSHLGGASGQDAHRGRPVDRLPALPAVVVVATIEIPVDRSRLVALAERGPDVSVYVLWLARHRSALPVVCRSYVEIDADTGCARAGFVRTGAAVSLVSVERADAAQALATARLLAPLDDDGAPVLDESDLPHRVDFVDLFDDRVADDPRAVLTRWHKNDSLVANWSAGRRREPGGLRALVGQGPSAPFALDLRAHGPHALVGGTTGSGKSEFLQTWLVGLAAEYAPDRLTFLLVDYKGGAAFADCVALPHTVGLVTDLSKPLVRRALISLRAEVVRRERLLNAKGAKDLQTLERHGDPDAPPSLVIVIDEFAALARDVPEFVDGVLDVAQRGRSLGLHLVLATQRPAGVISDNLRANTNLRIALRMADDSDSVDVVGIADAASFDPGAPGRAAAKLGPGRVLDFQAAYVGGVSDSRRRPEIDVRELGLGAGAEWLPRQTGHATVAQPRRDLERLVETLGLASGAAQLSPPRRPWLPELPTSIPLSSLAADDGPAIALGLTDDPTNQQQAPYRLDLDACGSLTVIGSATSGRSTLLRTLAVALSQKAHTHPVWLYTLDFSGGGLASLESLPTVGACIDGDDDERIRRLFRQLSNLVDERAALFATARASSLADYVARTRHSLPRIVVLLDGIDAFRAEYEFRSPGTVFESFTRVLAGGRQVGIHLAMTAERVGSYPTALQAHLGERIVLRLASDHEYGIAGVAGDLLEHAPPGRGVSRGLELHCATVDGVSDAAEQAARIDALAAELTAVAAAPPIRRLPEVVPRRSLPTAVGGLPLLGIADDTLDPIGFPVDGLFVVTGPYGSGRTTAMLTLALGIRDARPDWQAYLIATRPGTLATVTDWTLLAQDPDAADLLALQLAERFETLGPDDAARTFVVVLGVGDLEGRAADRSVARMIKAARRAGVVVVAETDTVTGSAAWQTHAELRAARAGLLLQPEEHDGGLLRTQLPRVTRTDLPVGRGFLVVDGRASCVQVATAEGKFSTGTGSSTPLD